MLKAGDMAAALIVAPHSIASVRLNVFESLSVRNTTSGKYLLKSEKSL